MSDTEKAIKAAAEAYQAALLRCEILGMRNTPRNTEERSRAFVERQLADAEALRLKGVLERAKSAHANS